MDILDYDTLRVIWWLLLGLLLIGFAIMDGFDLGVAMILPFVGRTDVERRVAINSIGPVWEGNQVWLILGAGAIFAAWPTIYAAAFSGFYLALFLVLASLILRPVGFDFRNKFAQPQWRSFWDWALFTGGVVPALVIGVAFGNLFLGVPFSLDDDLRLTYLGSGLFELLNPFGLLAGLVSLAMLATHGAIYLSLKTDGEVRRRATTLAVVGAPLTVALFVIAGIVLILAIPGYIIVDGVVGNGPSNPLLKSVIRQDGAWLLNYSRYPWMMIAPALGVAGFAAAALLSWMRRPGLGFIASGCGLFGIIATAGVSLFPFLMPSNLMAQASLTVWDASSSHRTLFVMLVSTVIFLPMVLAYTSFIFRVLKGRVTPAEVEKNSASLY